MNLYCTVLDAGSVTVARQTGYAAEDSATAWAGSQLPSAAVSPTTKTFSPQTVVAFSSTVVATLVHTVEPPPEVRAPVCSASAPPAETVAVTCPLPSTMYAGPVQPLPDTSPFITSQ